MSDTELAVLHLTIRDQAALYRAYMSFLEKGGLFVASHDPYHLGDEVQLFLTLMDEPETLAVRGRVVWLTPPGAQGDRRAGVGIEFSEQDAGVNQKIENYLAGLVGTDKATHTL